MARPIRIEEPWAFYHITSRGVARQEILKFGSHLESLKFTEGKGTGILGQAYGVRRRP